MAPMETNSYGCPFQVQFPLCRDPCLYHLSKIYHFDCGLNIFPQIFEILCGITNVILVSSEQSHFSLYHIASYQLPMGSQVLPKNCLQTNRIAHYKVCTLGRWVFIPITNIYSRILAKHSICIDPLSHYLKLDCPTFNLVSLFVSAKWREEMHLEFLSGHNDHSLMTSDGVIVYLVPKFLVGGLELNNFSFSSCFLIFRLSGEFFQQ